MDFPSETLIPLHYIRKKGRNGYACVSMCTTAIMQVSFLLIAFVLVMMPMSEAARDAPKRQKVVITNNHTNYLSVRCFSFDDSFDAQHLKPNQQYTFSFTVRKIFPSATMFNCSTNMGVFVAYRYDYECSYNDLECIWAYDENRTYHWNPKSGEWEAYDYNPNYESLLKGGVIEGYYAN